MSDCLWCGGRFRLSGMEDDLRGKGGMWTLRFERIQNVLSWWVFQFPICFDNNVTMFFCVFAGITGAILLCAFFVDLIVWYKAGSISFVNEQVLEVELHTVSGKEKGEPE